MIRITKIITRTLSFRLSLRVIGALATLLIIALLVMFYFSRKAVKEEVLLNAEETLDTMMHRIDNILLSVEQSAGNIYWKMVTNVHNREKLETYSRKLVEGNPYITECNIIWAADSNTINTYPVGWSSPQVTDTDNDHVGYFCLPIFSNQQLLANMVVEVSLAQLSRIVLDAKPSPNSFCTLLGEDGTVIMHPDSSILNKNILMLIEDDHPSMRAATRAMIGGQTGHEDIELEHKDYYVFYKPFERIAVQGRAMTELGWSAAIVLPKDDIFANYIRLQYIVIIIAFIGLTLLLLSCFIFIRRQLLPLRALEKSARQIANGFYDETIPVSSRTDEIGRLQSHFSEMQKSLSTRVGELQHLSDTLKERGVTLQATYERTKAADRMKTNFLHNMSDRLMGPVSVIYEKSMIISDHYSELTVEESSRLTDVIQSHGDKVTSILNNVLAESENNSSMSNLQSSMFNVQ